MIWNTFWESSSMSHSAEHAERQRILEALHARVRDILPKDLDHAATLLGCLALKVITEGHPPALSREDKRKIKDNYPSATEKLITERAMSDSGLMIALALAMQLARIAVDYNASTHCKALMDADDAHAETVGPLVARHLDVLWQQAEKTGMSDFGIACTMLLVTTTLATKKQVPLPLLIRPLLDSIEITMRGGRRGPEELQEEAIEMLMLQLGISRTTAKKYVDQAKRMAGEPH